MYVLSGDGFFREESKLEEAEHWLKHFREQGKKNIRLVKRTTIYEVLYPESNGVVAER